MNLLGLHPFILKYVQNLPVGTGPRLVTERKLRKLTGLPLKRQLDVALVTMPELSDSR